MSEICFRREVDVEDVLAGRVFDVVFHEEVRDLFKDDPGPGRGMSMMESFNLNWSGLPNEGKLWIIACCS